MGEYGENAILSPKMSFIGHFRAWGKSIDLKYKVFGRVNHDIIGTEELEGSK